MKFCSTAAADRRRIAIIAAVTSAAAAVLVLLVVVGAILLKNRRYKRYLQLQFEQSEHAAPLHSHVQHIYSFWTSTPVPQSLQFLSC
jgi:hypothetical protein